MSILSANGLTHSFGRFPALQDVSLSIRAHEVVGIVGENGAGKSTLLNVLSGTLQPTVGTIAIDDTPVRLNNYHEANQRGVWRIFQDPALIGSLPVYESLFLGHEVRFTQLGILRKRTMVRLAQDLVANLGLEVNVRDLTLGYDFATRQALEVGRAILLPKMLDLPSSFILFDEPTTGLSRAEVLRLLERMDRLRKSGAGVAFVSHRLEEVLDVCDRLIVLRDGVIVGEGPASDFDESSLHKIMVGRSVHASEVPTTKAETVGKPVLIVEGVSTSSTATGSGGPRRTALAGISFTQNKAQIVGIGGLLGSGKGQLVRLLAGEGRAASGTILLNGKPLRGSIAERKRAGVAFVPSDRPNEAVIVTQHVAFNLSLPSGHSGPRGFSTRIGFWRFGYERAIARTLIASLRIKAAPDNQLGSLSGGNQQKVSLARWIHREPILFLIENPTAGVDVGAKKEIYALLRTLSDKGATILYVTDDLPELIHLSDRILIMRNGRIVSDIDNLRQAVTEHGLVADMIGSATTFATA
jgi:ABC-type sugar transport system ATPase subunit